MKLYDAHNHLQDDRLAPHLEVIMGAARSEGVAGMVVNGSCESDWPRVLEIAQRFPEVVPSFGYHPWYVRERTNEWKDLLLEVLAATEVTHAKRMGVGEIGLDRWIENPDLAAQEEVFVFQMRVAAKRNLPVSLHCLKAWGWLFDLLKKHPRPARGFLLHSYGGPLEMVKPLAELGAYFSFPGYYAHERKQRQREAFLSVPLDRLLIETDAPDQLPPEHCRPHELPPAADGKLLNHPANLRAIYEFAARMYQEPLDAFAARIAANFTRYFNRA